VQVQLVLFRKKAGEKGVKSENSEKGVKGEKGRKTETGAGTG